MKLETLVEALIHNGDALTSSEMALLLSKASLPTLEQAKRGTLDGPAALRLRRRGWQGAKAAAAITTDPGALATLARHSSVRVRRQVAVNEHIDAATVDYLWSWAVKYNDGDTLEALASKVTQEQLAQLFAGPYTAPRGPVVSTVITNVDPGLWPGLLRASAAADDPQTLWWVTEVMVRVAADVGASLCGLYDAVPELGPAIVDMVGEQGTYVNGDVVELFARYKRDHPTAAVPYPSKPLGSFDDEAMVELFKDDPEAVRRIRFSKAHIRYPKTALWILQHADDYPEQARQVITDGAGSISAAMGPEVDAVLRASAAAGSPVVSKSPGVLLTKLAPYRLSSEALLALFRYQAAGRPRTVYDWLAGRFGHQLPTGGEIAALFADPNRAVGTTRQWISGRTISQPMTLAEFAEAFGRRELAEVLKTDWADEFVDALGPEWRSFAYDSKRFGRYLLERIHRDVGAGAEALQVALELLHRSKVSVGETLRSARALVPKSAA